MPGIRRKDIRGRRTKGRSSVATSMMKPQVFQGQESSPRLHYCRRADGNLEEGALKTHLALGSTISLCQGIGVTGLGNPEKKGTSIVPLQVRQEVNSPAGIILKIYTYGRKDNIENRTVDDVANIDEYQ